MKQPFNLMASCLLIAVITSCHSAEPKTKPDALAGFYRLHSIEAKDADGVWRPENILTNGDGYILYDGNGHMFVQLVGKGYNDFTWLAEEQSLNPDSLRRRIDSMSTEELRAAVTEFASNYAYEANYTIDDSAKVVQHQRLLNTIPAAWNTTVKRKYSFSDDTLILEPVAVNRRLKWLRQTPGMNQ